jgi:Zn-dependent protease
MENIIIPILQIFILIFSVVIHEVAHGSAAEALGDPTARNMGRLSLNPIKHLDPVGSFLVPLIAYFSFGFMIGWAKPVPINPYNFKDQRYGSAKAAFAGPAANISLAILFGLILRVLALVGINVPANFVLIIAYVVIINLLLAIFNLIPIPPLDGHHILFAFLPPQAQEFRLFLLRYGMFILLLFIFFGFGLLSPIIGALFSLLTGLAV